MNWECCAVNLPWCCCACVYVPTTRYPGVQKHVAPFTGIGLALIIYGILGTIVACEGRPNFKTLSYFYCTMFTCVRAWASVTECELHGSDGDLIRHDCGTCTRKYAVDAFARHDGETELPERPACDVIGCFCCVWCTLCMVCLSAALRWCSSLLGFTSLLTPSKPRYVWGSWVQNSGTTWQPRTAGWLADR